jgi:EAL domain-containing protein (putative c-di-GMP-specific phosphodiesterase class I)/GGDEF domain-containing protein
MLSRDTIDSFPDLLLIAKRDGTFAGHAGGKAVAELVRQADGAAFLPAWSDATGALLRQLVRKAITARTPLDAQFREQGKKYEVRVTPQGPDRALCSIRPELARAAESSLESTGEHRLGRLDRRGFLRRFNESMSVATLRERPLAVCVLYIEEIPDIAQIIATRVSEQIMSTAIGRLPTAMDGGSAARAGAAARPSGGDEAGDPAHWYLGQLGENLLALVIETGERDAIEARVSAICASLREPIVIGDAEFRLTPYAGVGVLGVDATSPRVLIDHARAAAAEARRAASRDVCFFSDTMRLNALARMDIARELRSAIADGAIRLRYAGRHDLRTGRRVAWVAYVRWLHPLRGEIRPAEFLPVAQTTGLATALSRSVLAHVAEDFRTLGTQSDADVRISLGALRDHVMHEDFVTDVQTFLAEGGVPAERLELRIAEKVFVARDSTGFRSLERSGVRLVVDEVGRGAGSLPSLARAPIWGLQLDREWVQGLRSDRVARNVCRAGIAMANALGLTPIASGVDDAELRDALLGLECHHGLGDLYGGLDASLPALAAAAAAR